MCSCVAGLGLLLVLLQVLYCTKPCCRQKQPSHNKNELNNPAIIKIKSFNEIEASNKQVKVPATIPEALSLHSEDRRSGSVPLSGSLKNLKSADIILNSSKLIFEWRVQENRKLNWLTSSISFSFQIKSVMKFLYSIFVI